MASFYIACEDCQQKLLSELDREPTQDEYEASVLFETSHSFNPTDEELAEAMTCPRCQGQNCTKTYLGYQVRGYIRGNGYLDRAGVSRDMNLCKLTQDDPYAEYRQSGEVDDLKTKLQRGGQHKANPKYFTSSRSMQEAVTQAAVSGPVEAPPPTAD
jgi:hypothetical protein